MGIYNEIIKASKFIQSIDDLILEMHKSIHKQNEEIKKALEKIEKIMGEKE